MGLDQYLYKKTFVKNYEMIKPEERHEVTITKGGKPSSIKPERVVQIVEEVGYWRKANQIHNWFVRNVMNGKDANNGQDYYVPREQLQKLLDTIEVVLTDRLGRDILLTTTAALPPVEKKAKELLPTQSGFFFGSTDYDEYYWEDLERTRDILFDALSEPEERSDFFYNADW